MSCLIYQHNGDHCTGKCDAACYNATGPICDCICGGRNHGVGLTQATENTRQLADEMIKEYCEKNKVDPADVKVNPAIWQTKLFE